MLSIFGITQQELLKEIFKSKQGLTVEELTTRLQVTRTAVNQHLNVLVRDGFVAAGAELQQTGGRPGRIYTLTPKGIDLFPKQYSWFSSVMLSAIKDKQGSEGLASFMKGMAELVYKSLEPRLEGQDRQARLKELVQILNELSYDAKLQKSNANGTILEAHNCVYHSMAVAHPEVCEFDLEILSRVTNSKVQQQACIVKGGATCRFLLGSR